MKQRSNRQYRRVSLGDVASVNSTRSSVVVWSEIVVFFGKLFAGTSLLFSVEYREACRLSYVKYIFLGYLYCQHFITTSGDYYSARINNNNNNSSSSIVVTIVTNTTPQYNSNNNGTGNGKKHKGK